MDSLSEKLSSILNDPESIEQLKNIASGLSFSAEPKEEEKESDFDVKSIMSLMSSMKAETDESRLLLALKPHLSSKRQKRVDSAIKILRLLQIAPLLKNSPFFDL